MNKTIFVSIASYRDFYCSKTLESLYMNASYPNNIYVGLCIQNMEGDEDCVLKNELIKPYQKNIITIRLNNYEAKGPTWARYLCTTLFNNQDYFFQIDSHTLFEKGWDIDCINMIDEIKRNTESKEVVLSHYPPSYEDYNNKDKNTNIVHTLCQSFFNDRGMVSFLGAEAIDMTKKKYIQTPHIAAGMFFCEGKCLKDVPYDPHLPNLFVGEEILHSARIWTSGYDIYTPTKNVIYHLYTRANQPKVWTDKNNFIDIDAFNKVKLLLELVDPGINIVLPDHVKENIDKYGIGKKRSLKDYYNFAGIDKANKKILKNFCKTPNDIIDVHSHNHKPTPPPPISTQVVIGPGNGPTIKENFANNKNEYYTNNNIENEYSIINILNFLLFILIIIFIIYIFKKHNLIKK
jgi:hypothetical protein